MQFNKKKLIIGMTLGATCLTPVALAISCSSTNNKNQNTFYYNYLDSFSIPFIQMKQMYESNDSSNWSKNVVENLISDFLGVPTSSIISIQFVDNKLIVKVKNYSSSINNKELVYVFETEFLFSNLVSNKNKLIQEYIKDDSVNQIYDVINSTSLNYLVYNHDLGIQQIDYNSKDNVGILSNKILPISLEIADYELSSPTYNSDISNYQKNLDNYIFDFNFYLYDFIFSTLSKQNINVANTNFFVNNNFQVIDNKLNGYYLVQFKNSSSKQFQFNLFDQEFKLNANSVLTVVVESNINSNLKFCVDSNSNYLGINLDNLKIRYCIDNQEIIDLDSQSISIPTHYDLFSKNNTSNVLEYNKQNRCLTKIKNIKNNSVYKVDNIKQINYLLSKPIFTSDEIKNEIKAFSTRQYDRYKSIFLAYSNLIDLFASNDFTLYSLLSSLGYKYKEGSIPSSDPVEDEKNIETRGPLAILFSTGIVSKDIANLINNLFSNQTASQFLYRTFDSIIAILDSFNSKPIDAIKKFLLDNLEGKNYNDFKYFINSLSSLKYTIKIFLTALGVTPNQLQLIYSIVDKLSSDPNIFDLLGQILKPKLLESIANLIPIASVQTILQKIASIIAFIEELYSKYPDLQTIPAPSKDGEEDKRSILSVKVWALLTNDEFLNSELIANNLEFPGLPQDRTIWKQYIIDSAEGLNRNVTPGATSGAKSINYLMQVKPKLGNKPTWNNDNSFNNKRLYSWINDSFRYDSSNDKYITMPTDEEIYNPNNNNVDFSKLSFKFKFTNGTKLWNGNDTLLKAEIPIGNLINIIPKFKINSSNTPLQSLARVSGGIFEKINNILDLIRPLLKNLVIGQEINFSSNNSYSYFQNVNGNLMYILEDKISFLLTELIKTNNPVINAFLSAINPSFSMLIKKDVGISGLDLDAVSNDVKLQYNQSEAIEIQGIINRQKIDNQQSDEDFVKEQKQDILQHILINKQNLDLSKIINLSFAKDKNNKYTVKIISKLPIYFEINSIKNEILGNGISNEVTFEIK